MSGSGVATTKPGKLKVIEEVTDLLEKSTMVFSVPSSGISANQVVRFRKEMPEGVTARVVKNTLMRRAAADSPFSVLSEITTGENFWVFVEGDDNLAEPIKYIGTFAKTMDKENVAWSTQPIKSGVFAGSILDGPGILAISKLPTKQELMQRLAIALKSVPTKVARSINLVPTKVGRVVKLAFAEGEGGEGAAEASPEIEASAVEEPAADAAQEGGDGEAAVTEVVEEAPATPEAEAGAEEAPAAE